MVNSPQSSRRTAMQSIMPKISINRSTSVSEFSESNMADFYVTGTPTATGETDIKFNKRPEASKGHYVLILGAIAIGLFIMKTQAEKL